MIRGKIIFHYLEMFGITKITCEDSHVILSFQNGQSLSHWGHIMIVPPILGSQTSLLEERENFNLI